MLRKQNLFPIIVMALLSLTVSAQKKNVIRTNISDPFYGAYNLSYERVVNQNQSVNLKLGYFKPTTSFLIDPTDFSTKDFTVLGIGGGLQTSFEYRFYTGAKDAPKGFYVAPYARYLSLKGYFTDDIDNTFFNVDGSLNLGGIGVQLGAQWLIKDIVSIDFSFFGAGVDYVMPKLVYETALPAIRSTYPYANIEPDVRDVVDDVSYFDNKLTTKVNKENLIARLPMFLPAFRFGLSVGIAF
jgi:hypothetical protein